MLEGSGRGKEGKISKKILKIITRTIDGRA